MAPPARQPARLPGDRAHGRGAARLRRPPDRRALQLDGARRGRHLRAILDAVSGHRDAFHVVTGDFNTLAPGEELDLRKLPPRLRAIAWLTGRRIRWETIQLMLDASYVDGYRTLHGADPGHTFPTWDPHVRLDYVFLPRAWSRQLTACAVVRDHPALAAASDHLPLLAELDSGAGA